MQVKAILVVRHTEKMEEVMGKVYSASTGHISGAASGENGGTNGQGLQCKYRPISGAAYGENRGTNGQGLQCKYRPY